MAVTTFTANVPFDCSTLANYKAWGQAIGQALFNFGWVEQTGHGELVTSNAGSTHTWTNVAATDGTSATARARVIPTFKGQITNSTAYTGSNTDNGAADIVTDVGLTYVCILSFTSGSPYTTPATDPTHWLPQNFEIWKSTGGMSTTNPLYLKIIYTGISNHPVIMYSLGTGVDANGRLTGAINLSTSAPLTVSRADTGSTSSATNCELDFCGDADNLSWALWRTAIANGVFSAGTACPHILLIDRAKTATGGDSDAYTQVYDLHMTASSSPSASSGIILNPSLGGVITSLTIAAGNGAGWIGVAGFPLGSLSNFGSTPPIPLTPLPGYIANPCLSGVVLSASDAQQGSVFPVWIYGALHKYLVVNADCTNAASRAVNGVSNSACIAIRWDS